MSYVVFEIAKPHIYAPGTCHSETERGAIQICSRLNNKLGLTKYMYATREEYRMAYAPKTKEHKNVD